MSTQDNLKAAFAGESQANRKYLAFAQKADAEGNHGAAKLFRAAAEAETIHALSHFKVLQGVKSTAENLQAAIEGETYEYTEMYPGFIAEAVAADDKLAKRTFDMANEAEKSHAALYRKALAALEQDNEYYVCSVCGYIHEGSAPDKCPVCGAPADKFKNIG
ncbi:MAG: rubrerythrin family protein [Peptococcaceae bacterium]|nr:rubrerythrin family protein [Peptococcaceae bacterium]